MNENPLSSLAVHELRKLLKSPFPIRAFEAQRELELRGLGTVIKLKNPYDEYTCGQLREMAYETENQIERYGFLREEAGRMMQTLRKTHWGHFPLWRWLLNAIGCRA